MNRKQNIFIFTTFAALWLCGALIILAGMIADSINNAGYEVQACQIINISVSGSQAFTATTALTRASVYLRHNRVRDQKKPLQSNKFRGLIIIRYNLMTSDWIEVYIGDTQNITQTYLDANYPLGKMVGCYASSTNVRLTLYNHNKIILSGIAIVVISIIVSVIYFIGMAIDRCRKKGYKDLDENSEHDKGNEIEIIRTDNSGNQGRNTNPQKFIEPPQV